MNQSTNQPSATPENRPTAQDIHAEKAQFPASQEAMEQQPDSDMSSYRPAGKLTGKKALITGGDSGIGRAVAQAFALEGADVAIIYLEEDADAAVTAAFVEKQGCKCVHFRCDVRDPAAVLAAVRRVYDELGGLNIVVNNAAYQMANQKFETLPIEQMQRTFETNILGYMYVAQAALPFLTKGDAIINTGSIVGITGNEMLVDYTATKGAIHAFTKSLALQLGERGIRVNCVAPGPVWTPAIPATMPQSEVEHFGHEVALKRPGQPEELAPAYVLLASADGSFITGSIVQVTGGKMSS